MKKVLVIAAHPDDEILGCGGTVAKHIKNGDHVKSIILCEGETMRNQNSIEKGNASDRAAKVLGADKPILVGLPDQHLDAFPIVDVISPIEKIVREFEPNIVYCHCGTDLNKDHRVVFEAALVALRPKQEFIETIYSFYTVGSTEWNYPISFNPDTWIGFDQEIMNIKKTAFSEYLTEVCDYPNPRSTEALINMAKFTGNQCCMEYAEAFETIRRVERS